MKPMLSVPNRARSLRAIPAAAGIAAVFFAAAVPSGVRTPGIRELAQALDAFTRSVLNAWPAIFIVPALAFWAIAVLYSLGAESKAAVFPAAPQRAKMEQEESMMNSSMILEARGLKKYYGKGETQVRALDGVDLDIERGRFTAIIGTSGSGKSTLLNMLGGLDTPTEGSIKVGDTELAKLNSEQATIFRRKQIGFIFQNYNLVPVLSVWENIIFPISLDGRRPDQKFIMEIVKLLGLEKKLDSLPGNLSGGQQQRVAIARALASKPSIILADEPTGNLDSKTSDDVIGLLKMTSQEFDQTIVMITHNPEIAAMADRVIRIEDGRIVAQ